MQPILLRFTGILAAESLVPRRIQRLDAFALQCHMADMNKNITA
jgi:hypothetical protein